MSTPPPSQLTPIQIDIGGSEYQAILTWPFATEPFYEAQIKRVLDNDIRYRAVMYKSCRVWAYRDCDGNRVGFGTVDICREYKHLTGGSYHAYIPVLAVNPLFQKRGHGRSIVAHLIEEATRTIQSWLEVNRGFSDLLFLDVYTANERAISLYSKCGFVTLNPDDPIQDPEENNELYIIMAKRLSMTSSASSAPFSP